MNVFSGPNAVRDFLNPDRQPMLPLVELPASLNPFAADGVRIFAKLMNFLPLANIKSLPALSMFEQKERDGSLGEVTTLIENSSGNTAFALGIFAKLFGIGRARAIVSHEVSPGKLRLLRFFGVEVVVNEEAICPDPADTETGIYKARKLGTQAGWWNPDQYQNKANPEAHARWTGPQILRQMEGSPTVFCAGLGTTGTMVGAGGFLKRSVPGITTVGVTRAANNPVPGVRTKNLLREISFDWNKTVDAVVEIGTKESFEHSLNMCRHGIVVGPSAGFCLAGLLRYLREKKEAGELDALRNKDHEVVAVFICPDSPFPYIDEYFEYLGEESFPQIENAELLQRKPSSVPTVANASPVVNVSAAEAFAHLYDVTEAEAWQRTNHGEPISLRNGCVLIDLRDRLAFDHVHLAGAERVDRNELLEQIEQHAARWTGQRVYLICGYGNYSRVVATQLRRLGCQALSIDGGLLEWSRLQLPRFRAAACRILHA